MHPEQFRVSLFYRPNAKEGNAMPVFLRLH